MQRVTPEYEVIASLRGAAPDVRGLEAPPTQPVKVRNEDLVIDCRSVFPRSEILH